jgi:hypothetical protein
MLTRRTVGVTLGLALTGALFGALAGMAVLTAGLFAIDIRHGRLESPFTWFGSLFSALVGGVCGAVLAPLAGLTAWRHVPVGRLFAHLMVGTMVGGGGAVLLIPSPAFVLLGGVLGFVVAGGRLASQIPALEVTREEPRAPPG